MRGEVLPIIPLSCLWAGGGRVSAHLGEPWGWRRSSSRPWPQRPVSQWFLAVKKKEKWAFALKMDRNMNSYSNHVFVHLIVYKFCVVFKHNG
ncbi:hypothetical protein Hanom_Chr03g00207621 [Helianthus anomalus]